MCGVISQLQRPGPGSHGDNDQQERENRSHTGTQCHFLSSFRKMFLKYFNIFLKVQGPSSKMNEELDNRQFANQ